MSTSWLLLRLCMASADKMFSGFSMHFVEVVSAFLLTGLAIAAILFLEQLAEKVEEASHEQSTVEPEYFRPQPPPPPPPTVFEVLSSGCSSCVAHDEPEMETMPVQGQEMHRPQHSAADAHTKNLEKAIRSIISSFALAVGLAWEHAFHAATHTIIGSVPVPFFRTYTLTTKTGVAMLSFALMLPAWLKYLVPKAHLSVSGFRTLMATEAYIAPRPTVSSQSNNDMKKMFDALRDHVPVNFPAKLPGQLKMPDMHMLQIPGRR